MAKKNIKGAQTWVATFVKGSSLPTLVDGTTWPIQPSQLDTGTILVGTFGECEMEHVAEMIVKRANERGGWIPFTRAKLNLESDYFAVNWNHDGFKDLANGRFIVQISDRVYVVTDVFISRIFNKFPAVQTTPA